MGGKLLKRKEVFVRSAAGKWKRKKAVSPAQVVGTRIVRHKMTKIYTKRGDKGKTTICGMEVAKNHPRLSALGALDELESALGVVLSQTPKLKILEEIQKDLMEIGAGVSQMRSGMGEKLKKETVVLEKEIDKMWETLPPLKNFILPQGEKTGSLLHLARAICRRAEREVVFLSQKERVEPEVIVYLNRLSDFLFALARWVNYKEGIKEKIWLGYE